MVLHLISSSGKTVLRSKKSRLDLLLKWKRRENSFAILFKELSRKVSAATYCALLYSYVLSRHSYSYPFSSFIMERRLGLKCVIKESMIGMGIQTNMSRGKLLLNEKDVKGRIYFTRTLPSDTSSKLART